MGLDMYLSKKTYVKNWQHKQDKHRVVVIKNDRYDTRKGNRCG